MNKEKYFMIREKEKEKSEMYDTIFKIINFFKKNEEYLKSFNSKESLEAIQSIKSYQELLSIKASLMSREVVRLFSEYRKECQHEILFRAVNDEPTGEYFCPLCRQKWFPFDEIPQSDVVIDVPCSYAHDDPSYAEPLYLALDFIIKNDIEWNNENLTMALKTVVSKRVYSFLQLDCKYKVRRKV